VFLVLILLLGSVRGALVCVLGIPASMSIALFGMHWAGVAGDLMSLGAIDFGFLVDGPIVLLEALIAAYAGQQLTPRERAYAYADSLARVVRPVAFAVAIIMLVYIPLLSLEGVEGRLFKPMATTMAFALFAFKPFEVGIPRRGWVGGDRGRLRRSGRSHGRGLEGERRFVTNGTNP
jgi:cobalt-zinc-cadmium resistance protein CzcA